LKTEINMVRIKSEDQIEQKSYNTAPYLSHNHEIDTITLN
jgi:hypothetical protein